MDKILTIVVPVYNMEQYLSRCLESFIIKDEVLLSQVQVIVVNDGSKDQSLAIACEYESKYPQVFEVIDKINGNYGSCINTGLEIATGKYFRILDADDWFDSDQFAIYVKKLIVIPDTDVIFTNYTIHQVKRKKRIRMKNAREEFVYNCDNYDFIHNGNRMLLRMHAMTFDTEFMRKINLRLQTGISYTDIEYCYFPLSKANKLLFLNVNLYQYYIGRIGQTVSKDCIIRNIDHFYKVAIRVVTDYLKLKNIGICKQRALIDIISNPISHIYLINLVLLKNPSEYQLSLMKKIDSLVSTEFALKRYTNTYTYRKLPFVKIWHLLGVRIGLIFGK